LGSGNGQFEGPYGIAVDGDGFVYVLEVTNSRVQKFDGNGFYQTQWGSLGSGDGQFLNAFGIAADPSGNVYVADTGNNRIQKFDASGTFVTKWGSTGSGNGKLSYPSGVAADGAGHVYVADYLNNRIQKFSADGTYLTQWGSLGSGHGELNGPYGLAADAAGNVYVAELYNHRIQKFTSDGAFITQWGTFGDGNGQFQYPGEMAVDAAGNVYVPEYNQHWVQQFTDDGIFVSKWGSFGNAPGQFEYPAGVATDAAGDIYVADSNNNRVEKFHPAPPPIAIGFDFDPDALNLASRGLWVTAFLEPPAPYQASDIALGSIRLNGSVTIDFDAPSSIEDHDGNGIPELEVKFSRAAMQSTLGSGDDVPVTVTGFLAGGASFVGVDHVRVIGVHVLAPAKGSHLIAGSVSQVRWETPPDLTVQWLAILQSLDGGATWSSVAKRQPNTGSYDWVVPSASTNQARVAVALVESADASGDLVDATLGMSDPFSIDGPVGVGDAGPPQLALRGVVPNPSRRELRVHFALGDSKTATLSVYDVSGRCLASRRVEGMGPGWHAWAFGERGSMPPGHYIIRLSQGGKILTARATLLP
jgi:DNA-binding beta-propeller fold protein YncE